MDKFNDLWNQDALWPVSQLFQEVTLINNRVITEETNLISLSQ